MAPTLNGGLRIDAEESRDWDVLRYVMIDAEPRLLAEHLTDQAGDEAEDWREYVQPDLEQTFESQINFVRRAIAEATNAAAGGPGSLFIEKAQAESWYGALNQARLALHAHYEFPEDDADAFAMPPPKRSAYFRYEFYMILQDLLLKRVMTL